VLPGVTGVQASADGRTLTLTVQCDLRDVLRIAAEQGAVNLTTHEPSLEEIFLRYYQGASAPASEVSPNGAHPASSREASHVGH
jgi:ABC-2 type transport system ATP-binding protein